MDNYTIDISNQNIQEVILSLGDNDESNDESNSLNVISNDESNSLNVKSDENVNSYQKKDIELFNDILQTFLLLQKEIIDIESEVKIRKLKLKELSGTLMSYIKIHNITNIKLDGDFNGSTLIPIHTKTINVDKSLIISTLQEYFIDNIEEFEKIMSLISENANTRETSKLTLQKPKKITSKNRYDNELNKVNTILDN